MDQKVLTAVDIATPTLRALQFLVRHGRSAVAVLSKEGKLITNLSISDLRRASSLSALPARMCDV